MEDITKAPECFEIEGGFRKRDERIGQCMMAIASGITLISILTLD
jgi:hypothetical protein